MLAIVDGEHFAALRSDNPGLGNEMMREQAVARARLEDQPFLLAFLQTQMFAVYCDNGRG